jgi:hypothetical protein
MPHASSEKTKVRRRMPGPRGVLRGNAFVRPEPESVDGDAPVDMPALRRDLARAINSVIGNREGYWHTCPEGCCRRARGCVAPRIACRNAPPSPPADPDTIAEMKALFREALDRAIAERGIEP